ncbi:TRM11 family SAM-dependent methyltransferase [Reinekea blandensis]|uniref:Uncharacterized protein n=1 Tax=Reinekea blandensis MED297 TaxID=314283 RepID=A4BAP1_9GAMM|nr:hypothetical protein [Reinekea blandensis]EAR10997.1 hypothetical protein MED297_10816 [Reinekea sp. MED297] [Reinekea blandensis MED297]
MSEIALLISPETKSAYFQEAVSVAEQEFRWVMPGFDCRLEQRGPFNFLFTQADAEHYPLLLRLSFCQGLFVCEGDRFQPINLEPEFALHEDFVFGSKFKGKTNERLTQLLLNVGLAALPDHAKAHAKVLDPLAGRATSLLWAMRYGLNAWGIEPDGKAQDDVRQLVKKWCKVRRQSHRLRDGVLGNTGRKKDGQFIEFAVEPVKFRLAQGDARQADQLFPKEKFDLLISDVPYGVQHFAGDGTRNPLSLIEQALPAWKAVMKKHSQLVLAFNSYLPQRDALIQVLGDAGLTVADFSAPHRMSESIVRDVMIASAS